jgi:hypothetical protein
LTKGSFENVTHTKLRFHLNRIDPNAFVQSQDRKKTTRQGLPFRFSSLSNAFLTEMLLILQVKPRPIFIHVGSAIKFRHLVR